MANFLEDKYKQILGGVQGFIGGVGDAIQQPFRQTLDPISKNRITKGQFISSTQKYNKPQKFNYNPYFNSAIDSIRNAPLKVAEPVQNFFEKGRIHEIPNIVQPNKNDNLLVGLGKGLINTPSYMGNMLVQGYANPILDTTANIGRTLRGDDILDYKDLRSSATKLGYNLAGRNASPVEIMKNIGGTVEPIAAFYSGGKAKNVLQNGGKETLLNTIKRESMNGLRAGALQGGSSNMANYQGTDPLEQFVSSVEGAVLGGAVGFGAGVVVPSALKGFEKSFGGAKNMYRYIKGDPEIKAPEMFKIKDEFSAKELTLIDSYKEQMKSYKQYESKGDRSMMNAVRKNMSDIAGQIGEIRKTRFDRVMQSGKINFGEIADAVKGKQIEPPKYPFFKRKDGKTNIKIEGKLQTFDEFTDIYGDKKTRLKNSQGDNFSVDGWISDGSWNINDGGKGQIAWLDKLIKEEPNAGKRQDLARKRYQLINQIEQTKPTEVKPQIEPEYKYSKSTSVDSGNSGDIKVVEEKARILNGEIKRLRKSLEEAPMLQKSQIRFELLKKKSAYQDLLSLKSQLKSNTERLANEQGRTLIKPQIDPNEALKQEAMKYSSAEEFYQRTPTNIRDQLREIGIKGQESFTRFWKDSGADKIERKLETLNPTGTVSVKYDPKFRATAKLGDNLTTLDKTMNKSPDELITIYRGVPKGIKSINSGDYITTNYDLAKSYTGEGNILSKKVKLSDILDDKTESLGGEYIYRPSNKVNQAKLDPTKPIGEVPKVEVKKLNQVLDNKKIPVTVKNPQEPFYNVNRVGVDNTAKQNIVNNLNNPNVLNKVTPESKPLTFKEVKSLSGTSKELNKTFTREEALKIGAEAMALRNKVAEYASLGLNNEQYQEALIKDKSFGMYIARLLGQRRVVSDPNQKTIFNRMISRILKEGADPEEVAKAAKGVDFNDKTQATEFYRKYIKASVDDWNDLLRYNSMLSSPNTHIINTVSNAINTSVVAPVEKTVTGGLDFISSKITGKERQYFAGEGVEFSKGYFKSVNKAVDNFSKALRGKTDSTDLDMQDIPLATQGAGKKLYGMLSLPMRMLEASDQFFRTLTQGAEESSLKYRQSKGVKVNNLADQASKNASYRLYRGDLTPEGQGAVLNAIDEFTKLISSARNNKRWLVRTSAKFTIPFLRTPMNIFKQGVEYSPAGVSTLIGANNKTEQLSKALIGSSVMLAASSLLGAGRLTWAEPTDQKKKQAFRDAGMQPYAVKVGNNWVSFTKLPPALSFNLAFVAALNDTHERSLMSDSTLDNILTSLAKYGNFLADQSYAKSLGDFLAAVKGDPDQWTSFFSNYPQQEIPFRALGGWLARLTDNYQRKIDYNASILDKQVQQLMMNMPFLSQQVPARLNEMGEPIVNQNRGINAISPFRVTTEDPVKADYYKSLEEKTKLTREKNELKKQMESNNGVTGFDKVSAYDDALGDPALPNGVRELRGTYYVRMGTTTRTYTNPKDAEEALKRYNFKQTGEKSLIEGNKLYKRTDSGAVSVKELPAFNTPKSQMEAVKQNEERFKEALSAYRDTNLRETDKQQIIQTMGVKESDLQYYDIATSSENARKAYLSDLFNSGKDYKGVLQSLINLRYEVNGQRFLSDAMITDLYKNGAISYADSQGLKNIVYNQKTKNFTKKPTKTSVKKVKMPKIPKLSTKKVTVKYSKPSKSVRDIRKKYANISKVLKVTTPKTTLK